MGLMQQIQSGRSQTPPRIMTYGTEGVGKAQPLDAKILTPAGFVAMGDLRMGDLVTGSDGGAHRILGVYPQGTREVFRVTFRDGSTTECCDDHLWFTQTRCERDQGLSGAVRTLRDIRKTLRYGTHFNHGVPRLRPVAFGAQATELPIEPWLLGMYLGDGHSSGSVVITNPEIDVQAKIAATLNFRDTCTVGHGMSVRVKSRTYDHRPSMMKSVLGELGIDCLDAMGKFVPESYLHASLEDRLALLQGLLDSDGYVTKPGAVEFCTVRANSTNPRHSIRYPATLVLFKVPAKARNSTRLRPQARCVRFSRW